MFDDMELNEVDRLQNWLEHREQVSSVGLSEQSKFLSTLVLDEQWVGVNCSVQESVDVVGASLERATHVVVVRLSRLDQSTHVEGRAFSDLVALVVVQVESVEEQEAGKIALDFSEGTHS